MISDSGIRDDEKVGAHWRDALARNPNNIEISYSISYMKSKVRYKLPAGVGISRKNRETGEWETFVTTKDAYYTEEDRTYPITDFDALYWQFSIPDKNYSKIHVQSRLLHVI